MTKVGLIQFAFAFLLVSLSIVLCTFSSMQTLLIVLHSWSTCHWNIILWLLATLVLIMKTMDLWNNDHDFHMYLVTTNSKVHVSFITFMLEDEHRLSLGMLMHVKCINELYSFLSHIPTYLHRINSYYQCS